jgi:hypothetical protein
MKNRIGRVQRQIRRLLITNREWPVPTSVLTVWAYPRIKQPTWHGGAARRAARRFLARAGRRGKEALWAPKSGPSDV